MQRHVKNYLKAMGYDTSSFMPCEVCTASSVDVHHIEPRSKFGKKRKAEQNDPLNLVGLCRSCHDKAHANILTKEYLKQVHQSFMERNKAA